jgi:hypothetical protein
VFSTEKNSLVYTLYMLLFLLDLVCGPYLYWALASFRIFFFSLFSSKFLPTLQFFNFVLKLTLYVQKYKEKFIKESWYIWLKIWIKYINFI